MLKKNLVIGVVSVLSVISLAAVVVGIPRQQKNRRSCNDRVLAC